MLAPQSPVQSHTVQHADFARVTTYFLIILRAHAEGVSLRPFCWRIVDGVNGWAPEACLGVYDSIYTSTTVASDRCNMVVLPNDD